VETICSLRETFKLVIVSTHDFYP